MPGTLSKIAPCGPERPGPVVRVTVFIAFGGRNAINPLQQMPARIVVLLHPIAHENTNLLARRSTVGFGSVAHAEYDDRVGVLRQKPDTPVAGSQAKPEFGRAQLLHIPLLGCSIAINRVANLARDLRIQPPHVA